MQPHGCHREVRSCPKLDKNGHYAILVHPRTVAFPKDTVYNDEITWATIKKLAIGDNQMKYCPSWVAPRKKGRPKNDARKLGIADHVQKGVQKRVAKRRRQNPAVHQTIVEGVVDEMQAGIQELDDIELEYMKDDVVDYA